MTLSNVFIGKKVVQQIYMNNALIYQANGWQSLPSTPQIVWQKQCGTGMSPYSSAFDSKKNLVISYYYSNACWLMKLDPDGNVLFNKKIDTADNGQYDIYIDNNDYIYCMTTYTVSSYNNKTIVRRLDTNGTQVKSFDISADLSRYVPSCVTYDEDYIYVFCNIATPSIYTYDHSGVLNTSKSGVTYNGAYRIAANGNSIYIATSSGVYKIPKSGIGTSTKTGTLVTNLIVNKIFFDQFDNLYFAKLNDTSNNFFGKYSLSKKQLCWPTIKLSTNSYIIDACVDYQCNIYIIYYDYTTGYMIKKYSADGQLQWSTDMYHPTNSASITADINGNIYQIGDSLYIEKLINLVKKGQ